MKNPHTFNECSDFLKNLSCANELTINSRSLVELPNEGIVKISGVETKKFLQGQLTCDVNHIAGDNSQLGAHCNQQGRVISLFHLVEFHQDLYLIMPRTMITIAITALKKYSVFFKVEISDVSDELMCVGIINSLPIPHEKIISVSMKLGSSRYLLYGNNEDLLTYFNTSEIQPRKTKASDWYTLNMLDGIPSLSPETSGVFLPHELNLDKLQAISFDKGCYTGQEIIARMHYRGKIKSRMHIATINATKSIHAGADIFLINNHQRRVVGKVVTAHLYENNCYNALISIEESSLGQGQLFPEHDDTACITIK